VLFIGKEFERKGGPQLLQAFSKVRAQLPNAELWLVTSREDVGGAGVRRIAPTNDHAAIAELYRAASVFAMPSRCETWGDVFLEAMAYGLPCIGTTNDAMPEIIEHGTTGYVVEPDDVSALARHLDDLLRSPELRQQMGAQGRLRVAERFTWARVVERMLPVLRDVAHMSEVMAAL
jgi:glycosyltransferase involved in cell wall biosynthesis